MKLFTKVHENYLLVESAVTLKRPRQRTICSFGHLKPRPREEWLRLARKIEVALAGQLTFEKPEPEVEKLVKKAKGNSFRYRVKNKEFH